MLNLLFDFLSTLVFVVLFSATDDIVLATGAAMAAGALQIGWELARHKKVAFMQGASLMLVVVFGTATLFFDDPRFMIVKPTIVYTIIGLIMLKKGWMERYLPDIVTDTLPHATVNMWGYVWAGLMFTLAAINAALGLGASQAVWAWFISIGANLAKAALFGVQYWMLRRAVIKRLQSEPAE